MYVAYKCLVCKTEFIIPSEHVIRMELAGKYIACNFGHKNIKKIDKYADLKECMQQRHSTLI